MKKTLLGLLLVGSALTAYGEDYSEDIRKNDDLFLNLNFMHGQGQKNPYRTADNTYVELEFGGRSGVLDFYGYVDFMNITGSTSDDTYDGDNFFTELKPRLSIDGMTGKDLSLGPIKEWYVAGYFKASDYDSATGGLVHYGIGLGTDIELPWFGKTGLNLLAIHKKEDKNSIAEGKWDGYSLQWDWFKPFYTFDNGAFVAYQGYMTYDFGMTEVHKDPGKSDYSFQWYHGIYYHINNIALGYGLKIYKNMANIHDGASYDINGKSYTQDTTGVGHYFDITYKF